MDIQINNKFQEIQEIEEDQCVIFGDSAYGRDTHVMTYHSIVDDDAEKSTICIFLYFLRLTHHLIFNII